MPDSSAHLLKTGHTILGISGLSMGHEKHAFKKKFAQILKEDVLYQFQMMEVGRLNFDMHRYGSN